MFTIPLSINFSRHNSISQSTGGRHTKEDATDHPDHCHCGGMCGILNSLGSRVLSGKVLFEVKCALYVALYEAGTASTSCTVTSAFKEKVRSCISENPRKHAQPLGSGVLSGKVLFEVMCALYVVLHLGNWKLVQLSPAAWLLALSKKKSDRVFLRIRENMPNPHPTQLVFSGSVFPLPASPLCFCFPL